jgi:hypothetical protein
MGVEMINGSYTPDHGSNRFGGHLHLHVSNTLGVFSYSFAWFILWYMHSVIVLCNACVMFIMLHNGVFLQRFFSVN